MTSFTSDPSEYTLYWNFFHRSGFLSNLHLPWKTEFALKIFTVFDIFFTIQHFWATLHLSWKTEFALKFLIVFNILFTFRIFWATSACPENRVCPDNFGTGRAAAALPPPRAPMNTAKMAVHAWGVWTKALMPFLQKQVWHFGGGFKLCNCVPCGNWLIRQVDGTRMTPGWPRLLARDLYKEFYH